MVGEVGVEEDMVVWVFGVVVFGQGSRAREVVDDEVSDGVGCVDGRLCGLALYYYSM